MSVSPNLYDRRFVLFSGKGGVGKTMMASAFALSCARRGQRTLLIELNVKDKVSSLFGSQDVSTDIVEVEDNLFSVNVTPDAALEEYALMILRVKLIYRAVFENRIVRSFLKVVPGLNELLMLGKAYFHAVEAHPDGRPVWDMVVLDAPATGHGIFLFQIPSVITNLISSGHMYEEARRIEDLMRDPERTALVLVTLAEDMPVNETLMLRDVVREKLKIPIGCVIANAIYSQIFNADEARWLEEARTGAELPEGSDLQGFLEAARFRDSRVEMQQGYLERLRQEAELPILQIPYYFAERTSFAIISEAAAELEQQIEGVLGDKARSAV